VELLRRRWITVVALLTAVALSTTVALLATAGVWSSRPFGTGNSGAPSIVVDSLGNAHIVVPWGELRYYTTAGGAWTERVLPEADFVFHGSIAVDRQDRLHVAYSTAKVVDNQIASNATLRYATNRAGDWSIQTVDTEGVSPYQSAESIAVDPAGNPHISYSTVNLEYADYNLTRKYAVRDGEKWTTRVLELSRYAIWSHSQSVTGIAVDAQGRAHIAYAFDSFTTGYATNQTGSWVLTFVSREGGSDLSAPIALDSKGRVHVAFYRLDEVVHAVRDGTGWRNVTIDHAGRSGARSISLAIDREDSVHISYVNRVLAHVLYATNSGGTWRSTIVDRGREPPYGTCCVSLAVGPDARPRMAYVLDSGLKYATTSLDSAVLTDFALGTMPYLVVEATVAVGIAVLFRRRSRRRTAG
jgi:hypothetical protein